MVFPYLKGLIVIKKILHIVLGSIVYSVFVVITLVYLFRFLTIGIRALSLARVVGNYFLFLQIFFPEKIKEGRDIPDIFSIFL